MIGDTLSKLYNRLFLGYRLPRASGSDEDFYKRSIELGREAFNKDPANSKIYFKIVPESSFVLYIQDGEERVEYSVRLKVFSSPRVGLLNKIPERIHKVRDMDQIAMIVKDVCEKKMPTITDASFYSPFEFMKEFSAGCVMDQADEIRRKVPYRKEIIHPFNLATPPRR